MTTSGVPGGIRVLVEEPLKSHMKSQIMAMMPRRGGPYVFSARFWRYVEDRAEVYTFGVDDLRGYGNCMPGMVAVVQRETLSTEVTVPLRSSVKSSKKQFCGGPQMLSQLEAG